MVMYFAPDFFNANELQQFDKRVEGRTVALTGRDGFKLVEYFVNLLVWPSLW